VEAASIVFLIPVDGPSPGRWVEMVLQNLPNKGPAEAWAALAYVSGDLETEEQATPLPPLQFHTSADAIAAEFRRGETDSCSTDLWRAIWHAARAAPFPGLRKLVVLHPPQVSGSAGPELIAAVKSMPGQMQVVASGPAEALMRFCRRTASHWAAAEDPERLSELVADACLALTPTHDLQWEGLAENPSTLRLRVRGPSICGETTVEISRRLPNSPRAGPRSGP
jgi:hypothetical protein